MPKSLLTLTALLIQHSVIEFTSTYAMLEPSDEQIEKDAEKELADAKEFVRKLNVVSTNKTEQKEETETELAAKAAEKVTSFTLALSLMLASIPCLFQYKANQKFGLLEAFLSVGAWKESKAIFDSLPEFYAVSHEPVAAALQKLVHITIEPLHQKYGLNITEPNVS